MESSRALSARMVSGRESFRLDYLLHLISFLAFAWVYVLGQVFENQSLRLMLRLSFL